MTKQLRSNYNKYLSKKKTDKSFFSFFKSVMPEIVTRTTRLEGEKVNKKFVSSLFLNS